jgi:Glycosyl transferase family 2
LRRFLTLLAAVGFAVQLVRSVEWFRGIRTIPVLRDAREPHDPDEYPALSVVVPACNEERVVRGSVESALEGDYPGKLEVIATNDRSTDRTGEVLKCLESERPGLRVVHVKRLPEGWLGKNHALYLGAAGAEGEWLLFTDADVRFSPSCFRNAVGYAVRNGLDHLTLPPEIFSRSVLLRGFVAAFELIFEMFQRPWRAGDPRAKEHVGVGAFNLIRREIYPKIGTHRAVAMRPDDDMKLAKQVKKGGFRQGVAYGTGLLGVEWHQSLGGAIRGLSKSIFPGVDYRLGPLALATVLLLLTDVLPFLGVAFASRVGKTLFGSNVLLTCAIYGYRASYSKSNTPLPYAALHPLSVCLFLYAVWRSASTTLANGGIEWRGTKYPLKSLKANVV